MIELLDSHERRHLRNGRTPDGGEPPTPILERYTLAELAAAHPTLNRPVVDGLLREGETGNIISYSKVGKSWLAYDLALSVVTGDDWLGRFSTTPGKVLLVDNELHRPTIAHRILTVGDAKALARERYDIELEVWSLRGNLRGWGDVLLSLRDTDPGEYRLIVFDAKYRFTAPGANENDNAAETHVYNQLDQIAEYTRAACVVIHHASKGSQTDKRVTDVGAGAGAQSRAADAHIVLREHEEEGVVVLEAAVRSFPPVKPLPLRWAFPLWLPELDADPSALRGRQTAQEQRQGERDKEGIAAVVRALMDGPLTAKQLRRSTGYGKYRADRLLDLLCAEGHVTTEPTTIRGRTFEQFRLIDE